MISFFGELLKEVTTDVPPGQSSPALSAQGAPESYCKFTVADGTRADIRAKLGVVSGGNSSERLVVPAE
jgi:hypothetical protein